MLRQSREAIRKEVRGVDQTVRGTKAMTRKGEMTSDVAVRKNQYYDSVFLMSVASRMQKEPGVADAAALMGTANNKQMLVEMGFDPVQVGEATAHDLVVALRGKKEAVRTILADLDSWLQRREGALSAASASSWDEARRRQPGSNIAVISVPGRFATREAHAALDAGMNVFLFSDHVSVEDELALKKKASQAGLIVMGPDCGTAVVAGMGIGFANAIRRGPVGVVASSGTGLQEFTTLIHRAGSGISQALGTGGRDLSDAIGGLSTQAALRALEADQGTRAIAVLTKPPGTRTLEALVAALADCRKPVVVCLLGLTEAELSHGGGFKVARTVDEAASLALQLTGGPLPAPLLSPAAVSEVLSREVALMNEGQKYIRGLFAGGTLCYEAQQILRDLALTVHSNAPLPGMPRLADARASFEHTLVDMGADEFTEGRPHPMIDASQRSARIRAEGRDPQVAVLLLDVVLGYGAADDPAGDLAAAITSAEGEARRQGGHLAVVASVCGTDGDPQGLEKQEATLRDAGVIVFPSNAQATLAARELIGRTDARRS